MEVLGEQDHSCILDVNTRDGRVTLLYVVPRNEALSSSWFTGALSYPLATKSHRKFTEQQQQTTVPKPE